MAFKNVYLISYNLISFLLWLTILVRGSILLVSYPLPSLYDNLLSPLLTSTQSLAVLEILHASLGLVRASPLTTALQVVGKNLVVWTVMVPFPKLMTGTLIGQWGFAGCLICWSLSEVLRFGYFVVLLTSGGVPGGLKWLRYSAFLVLYPIGIVSEAALVCLALTKAQDINGAYRIYLFFGFLTYVPASYILYGHMLTQRRKMLR